MGPGVGPPCLAAWAPSVPPRAWGPEPPPESLGTAHALPRRTQMPAFSVLDLLPQTTAKRWFPSPTWRWGVGGGVESD